MKLLGRIVVLLIVVAVCIFAYRAYQQNKEETGGSVNWINGKPSAAEKAAFDKKNSGGDDPGMTGASSTAQATVKTPGTSPMVNDAATQPAQGSGEMTNQAPADRRTAVAPAPAGFIPPAPSVAAPTYQTASASIPATDSIAPNPPNGSAFTGTGQFLLYRQGNLTWRLNTATGRTCIAFATMDEWRKALVMRNGCGRSA